MTTDNMISLDLTSVEAGLLVQLCRVGGSVLIGEFDEAIKIAFRIQSVTTACPGLMTSLISKLEAITTVAENLMLDELLEKLTEEIIP